MGKSLPPIPPPPPDSSSSVKKWMNAVKEALEVRLGRRGDPSERAVTVADLERTGGFVRSGSAASGGLAIKQDSFSGGVAPPERIARPNPVEGFTAHVIFGGVGLSWTRQDPPRVYHQTEIAVSDSPDLETATVVGASAGTTYSHRVNSPDPVQLYFWARHVNALGQPGAWSSYLSVTTRRDFDMVFTELRDKHGNQPYYYDEETNTTYINTTFIRQADIKELVTGSVTIGDLGLNQSYPALRVFGDVDANGRISAQNLSISGDSEFRGSLMSDDSSGQQTWQLNRNGSFRLGPASGANRVVMNAGGLRVYHNGVEVVRIGRL